MLISRTYRTWYKDYRSVLVRNPRPPVEEPVEEPESSESESSESYDNVSSSSSSAPLGIVSSSSSSAPLGIRYMEINDFVNPFKVNIS